MKMNKKLILASSLFLVSTQLFANNLLQNGSFESPALASTWQHIPTISNWAIAPAGVKGELQREAPNDYPDGKQILELASTTGYSISQSVVVTVGDKYILSFWAKYRKAEHNLLDVHLSGTAGDCGTQNDFSIKTTGVWTKYSYCICPTSREFKVTFEQKGAAGGGYGLHLDNVILGQP
ncbi:MAG: DUF642 domain-containing protein [Methylobacter sp.]|jgi:hypothetical protein|nr:DUF642 domain-containing protein [Methylobacter sp.]